MKTDKLRAILIDDEQDSITTLQWLLEDFSDKIEIIDSFQNPKKAIECILKSKPDLLFLDIQMPEINGFELLKEVQGYFKHVIFITAHDEYAVKAFDVSAVAYLLKPVASDKLEICINNILKNSNNNIEERLEVLLGNYRQNNIEKIALPTIEGLVFKKPTDIVYCKSDGNYTSVVMCDKSTFSVTKTLKEIEKSLALQYFFRIHNSYLINLNYLKQYYKGKSAYVLLEDGTQIPISRNKKTDFLDSL